MARTSTMLHHRHQCTTRTTETITSCRTMLWEPFPTFTNETRMQSTSKDVHHIITIRHTCVLFDVSAWVFSASHSMLNRTAQSLSRRAMTWMRKQCHSGDKKCYQANVWCLLSIHLILRLFVGFNNGFVYVCVCVCKCELQVYLSGPITNTPKWLLTWPVICDMPLHLSTCPCTCLHLQLHHHNIWPDQRAHNGPDAQAETLATKWQGTIFVRHTTNALTLLFLTVTHSSPCWR